LENNMHDVLGALLLHEAISEGDLEGCRRALDKGANPDLPKPSNETYPPLVRAIGLSFTEGALLLIERGASVGAVDVRSPVPLAAAAGEGNMVICKALIGRGADINESDITGESPLFLAAAALKVDACRLLIENGANVNTPTGFGSTPLRAVALQDNPAVAHVLRLLISAGADQTALSTYTDINGERRLTPFQCAVARGRHRNVALLIDEFGEDPAQVTLDGVSMVDLAMNPKTKHLLMAAAAERAARTALGPATCSTSMELPPIVEASLPRRAERSPGML
jgi:ankyrin repeat protein